MAQLDIAECYITQMQRITVTFAVPDTAPANSRLAIYIDAGAGPVLHEFSHIQIISNELTTLYSGRVAQQFALGTDLQLQVVQLDSNSAPLATGALFYESIEVSRQDETLIQQAIYDTLLESAMVDRYGRAVNILNDGFFVPEDISDGESVSNAMPIVAIGRPDITQCTPIGLHGQNITYRVEITVSDNEIIGSASDVSHLYAIARNILGKLGNGNHNLKMAGIPNKALSHSFEKTGDITTGDNLNTVTLITEIIQFRMP